MTEKENKYIQSLIAGKENPKSELGKQVLVGLHTVSDKIKSCIAEINEQEKQLQISKKDLEQFIGQQSALAQVLLLDAEQKQEKKGSKK